VRAERVDEQSDVYSVAATLYFLLTGRAPHQTADAAATLARIVSDPAPSMLEYRPDLPGMLDDVVARGLERDRADRWGSLAEFREALVPFVPGRLSMAGMGMRFGAYLLDAAILHLAAGVLGVSLSGAALSLVTRVRLQLGTQAVVAVLYFGILEGL